jgi:hypothetical protein
MDRWNHVRANDDDCHEDEGILIRNYGARTTSSLPRGGRSRATCVPEMVDAVLDSEAGGHIARNL